VSLIEVQNLKVSFHDRKHVTNAVDGISFSVDKNEVVGLVGESGSGKTLTGYSILGITPKEANASGSIKFEGKEILGLSDKEMLNIRGRQISIVFQEPFTSLNPVFTVGYQVEEMIRIHKNISKKKARSEVLTLLDKVRIRDPHNVYYDYPHRLSGGERQRAMIAMAIALSPKLLIADEPTTALDVTIQSEILKLLSDLKKEMNLSVLFITHDFGIINEMADRVLVMKDGRIVERGDKNTVLTRPKHEYTKSLIDAVPKIGLSTKPITTTREIFLEIKNLNKTYRSERGIFRKEHSEINAVKDVSIRIEKGTTLGLVGESGCGKSTLGRLILGLDEADSGDVFIQGKLQKYYTRDIRKMLQIVFQDPYSSLDPKMRMGDIVLEGAGILGIASDSLLKDVLNKAQLDYGDRCKYPHQFSGGQRQRIAIARALAVNPEFIVLDEPVSSLDVLIQKDILDLLKALKRQMGLTYLFISHDLRVVELMSDEVCVMRGGEIVERGSTEKIYRHPENPYTKELLASIPSISA